MKKTCFLIILLLTVPNFSWSKSGMGPYPTEKRQFVPIELKDKTWAYVDYTGKIVFRLDPKYQSASEFSDGVATAWIPYQVFFIDTGGKTLFEQHSNMAQIYPFSDGLAAFKEKGTGLWGFIDKTGKVVIPAQFQSPGGFQNGLAKICIPQVRGDDHECQQIDKMGKVVRDKISMYSTIFVDGIVAAHQPDCKILSGQCRFGLIDKSGNQIVEYKYNWISPFSEGLAVVLLKDRCGYISLKGEVAIPIQYLECGEFHEGLAPVRSPESQKDGYIDQKGKLVIDDQYDAALPFSEGLAAVQVHNASYPWGAHGFINKKGEYVIKPKYSLNGEGYFNGGLIKVVEYKEKDERHWIKYMGYINQKGEQIKPTEENGQ